MSGSVEFVRATRDDLHHFDLRNMYTAVNRRAPTEAKGSGDESALKKAKKREAAAHDDPEDGSQALPDGDPHRVSRVGALFLGRPRQHTECEHGPILGPCCVMTVRC